MLITVLFMATTMFPLFLPEGMVFNKLASAIVAVCLFSGAYMAETVRGGLQAIPRGQYEASAALGHGYWQTMGLIVMPQALKLMIPNIVGSFIGLFKDTTLVAIIGLYDLLGMIEAVSQDPKWIGLHSEPLMAAALMYFVGCFAMSRYSMHLENPWPGRPALSAREGSTQEKERGMSAATEDTVALQSNISDQVVIELTDVNKWFGDFHVLKDINLSVSAGERIVISGPRVGKIDPDPLINRLEEHQTGDIIVNDTPLDNNLKNIDAVRREVGMVFQQFNLFPHLTVLERIALWHQCGCVKSPKPRPRNGRWSTSPG